MGNRGQSDLPMINVAGLTLRDLLFLSRQIFRPAFGIRHTRPFHLAHPRILTEVWHVFAEALSEPKAPIIMSFAAEDWAHWTVVEGIDANTLWLADSDGMKNILRKEASIMKVSDQRPLKIQWSDVFVVRQELVRDV